MSEGRQYLIQSLFLSGIGTVVLAVNAAVLADVQARPAPLHWFLPLSSVCYAAAVALGLLAWRQLRRGRAPGRWTVGQGLAAGWSVFDVAFGLYGVVVTILAVRMGL
jgi:hypothetical protein